MVPAMKNSTDERGMNPLHVAAANGRLDCVKWLAVSGVDLAEETPTGYTAMHLAAMNGHVNCMMVSSTHVKCSGVAEKGSVKVTGQNSPDKTSTSQHIE